MQKSKKHSLTAKQADEFNKMFALGKYASDYESIISRFLKCIRKIFSGIFYKNYTRE